MAETSKILSFPSKRLVNFESPQNNGSDLSRNRNICPNDEFMSQPPAT